LQPTYKIIMIIVPIKENETIDKALKKYKKKFEKTGTVKQLRARQAFEKPSITRRTEIKKAIYKNHLQAAVEV
jgi:small subunit ribosomal protein S21